MGHTATSKWSGLRLPLRKSIIVSPPTSDVAPVITVILSLAIYKVVLHPVVSAGIVLAILSTLFLVFKGEEPAAQEQVVAA